MIDSLRDRDPVELLADEFAARCRKGESPSVFEYVAEYPQYAEQIEQLFPAVAMMEKLRIDEDSRRESLRRRTTPLDLPDRIGDFEILREIGRGGMGVVFEAVQRSLARRVAVKVLPEHVLCGNRRLERFQREARLTARLRHTAIVPVFGVGEQDGFHYYVMPLVRAVGLDEVIGELRAAAGDRKGELPPAGKTAGTRQQDVIAVVRTLVAKKFPAPQPGAHGLPPRESRERTGADRWTTAARLGLQAACALEYAHAQGTLHRDIKPGNLLVDEEGNACLADFGLARAIEPSRSGDRSEKEVAGTPRYMAPEQLRGVADARSDIYGLGLTLHELLTCTGPGWHPRSQPVPPREVVRTIPRDLEAIVLKCLTRDPMRRYPTAAALAADLRRFLEDRPVRARRASRLERTLRWCRRNPALAAVSATAVLLLAAFTATALAGHLQTRAAYGEARRALAQTEATSGVALEVLEGIYLQLAPERVWIPSDSDPAGQACACVGLRSARPAAPDQRDYIQVEPSEQTAALLENLLVFYDRLAEQVSDDARVMLQSAIATRRVGDIRQRLGQIDQAEREYRKAIAKFEALGVIAGTDAVACIELARSHNEIGNVRSARFEPHAAYDAHREALDVLRPTVSAQHRSEECRYELARTYFFLASRHPGHGASSRHRRIESHAQGPARFALPGEEYRKRAVGLLEKLVRENPDAADYRFLLALSYRPLAIASAAATGSAAAPGRRRALDILESLKRQYPQVADYRYELAATYAWVHVGLFPWQGRSVALLETERTLHQALDEIEWLVGNNPTIPHFARSNALIVAKLGAVCSEVGRPAEGADWFERALDIQSTLLERFPDLPVHDRVLVEFFRFRLATLCLQLGDSAGEDASAQAGALLAACVDNLTELRDRREVADDLLAASTLRLAEDALGRVQRR